MIVLEMAALLSCALFAGAAIYINLVEHPARLECGTELAARVFGPSYHRATAMQASLAIIAALTGVSLGVYEGQVLWFWGAGLIFFVVPFTLLVIMPTNKQLLDPDRDRASADTRQLLEKWGLLHAVRSVVSVMAAALYVYIGVAT